MLRCGAANYVDKASRLQFNGKGDKPLPADDETLLQMRSWMSFAF